MRRNERGIKKGKRGEVGEGEGGRGCIVDNGGVETFTIGLRVIDICVEIGMEMATEIRGEMFCVSV